MRTALFILAAAAVLFVQLAVLELNRNRPWSLVAAILFAAGFAFFFRFVLWDSAWYLRLAAWVVWLALFAGLLFVSWGEYRRVPAVKADRPERTEPVSTSLGLVRGVKNAEGDVEVFAGIPYAKPPVGELRWREPEDPEPWDGVLEADSFAPMSMQPLDLPIYESLRQIVGYHDYKLSFKDNYNTYASEDSLYLNLWRPAGGGERLPVLVFLHGGSLNTGQPWLGEYSGEGLAKRGMIAVTVGYRVGPFGFLALEGLKAESKNGATGNYGLLDQIKALEWIRKNAAFFGGDPDNVTLAGESAGAVCVSALCVSPLAKGLFRHALLESSTLASNKPPHTYRGLDEALESGRQLMARYGAKTVEELRAVPAKKLTREAKTQHHVTVDGFVLPEPPHDAYSKGVFNCRDIMHGYNLEESGPFTMFDKARLSDFEKRMRRAFAERADDAIAYYNVKTDEQAKKAWAEAWGAYFFDYPHYCLNRLAVKNGVPVYEYTFTKHNGRLGPWHSGEQCYFYGNLPKESKLFTGRDYELEEQITAYIKNFAANGDPNGKGLPEWKRNASSLDLMELGEVTAMTKETKKGFFDILDGLTEWS